MSIGLLDLPLTIRQQIYEELLLPPITQKEDGKLSQEDATVDIFYTNRQVYAESSDVFYAKNIFIVISSNTDTLFEQGTYEKTPVFRKVRDPRKITQCPRFAMTMEFLGISQLLAAHGTPQFIVTAQALPLFATALNGKYKHGIGCGMVQMQVQQTFRYTTERFSELVFGRFLSAERLPRFVALKVDGTIDDDYIYAIMSLCANDETSSCSHFSLGLRCYKDRVWYRMQKEYDPDGQSMREEIPDGQTHELPRLMLRMLEISWSCHDYRQSHLGHKCDGILADGPYRFGEAADLYNVLALSYMLAAKRAKEYPEQAKHAYLQARKAAEDGIKYLCRDDRVAFPDVIDGPDDERRLSQIERLNRARSLLSLKAAKACSKLGDRKAATAYTVDVIVDAPYFNPGVKERLLRLSWKDWPDLPDDSPYIGPAILWKMRDSYSTRSH
ncbi:hypothetical protein K458DRAFT_383828 [Lentithecium fluviatile CBS 122367]|uniref:Uncharacterized protein n=1 Tax=Lentithecium fluviatile CBS 122367 TaxID=1168545 RepID=A0A6G1JGB0_9PLEO|nr:hypothetical protein K458DRAFT_383828 [Lentithecium fluviatile CBS 122367]